MQPPQFLADVYVFVQQCASKIPLPTAGAGCKDSKDVGCFAEFMGLVQNATLIAWPVDRPMYIYIY